MPSRRLTTAQPAAASSSRRRSRSRRFRPSRSHHLRHLAALARRSQLIECRPGCLATRLLRHLRDLAGSRRLRRSRGCDFHEGSYANREQKAHVRIVFFRSVAHVQELPRGTAAKAPFIARRVVRGCARLRTCQRRPTPEPALLQATPQIGPAGRNPAPARSQQAGAARLPRPLVATDQGARAGTGELEGHVGAARGRRAARDQRVPPGHARYAPARERAPRPAEPGSRRERQALSRR